MTLPATSDFTGTNGADLSTAVPGFVNAFNSFTIQTNQAVGSLNDDCRAYWTADSFSANQYSKAVVAGMSSGAQYRGVVARGSGSSSSYNGYEIYTDGTDNGIAKVTNGSFALLKSVTTTFADGDVMEMRVTGTSTTTIQFYKNNILVDSFDDSSSPITSGSAGIYSYGFAFPGIDDWEGGNLAGSAASPIHRPLARYSTHFLF